VKRASSAQGILRLLVLVAGATLSLAAKADPDPIEPVNRAIFSFNDGVDKYALKPAAQGYVAVVPLPARVAFSNFIDNFKDLPNAFNNLLQGKVSDAASDVGRILVNTTLGIGGAIDVASEMGLEKHNEDFGQTLGRWGMGPGPYLVLPLLGPSTLRDTAALPVDYYSGGRHLVIDDVPTRNIITGVDVLNKRAALLGADDALGEAALDKYGFVRNFYLQRRVSLIYDGQPPREKFDDEDAEPGAGSDQGEKQ